MVYNVFIIQKYKTKKKYKLTLLLHPLTTTTMTTTSYHRNTTLIKKQKLKPHSTRSRQSHRYTHAHTKTYSLTCDKRSRPKYFPTKLPTLWLSVVGCC